MRWQIAEIVESRRNKNGTIELITADGRNPRYVSIRAGLDPESRYYIICGMEWVDEQIYAIEPGHRAIDILLEYRHENLILDDFFYKIVEDGSLYFCNFFMDREETHNEDFQKAYAHFKSNHRNPHGALLPAPWVENFKLGLGKIKSLVKEDRLAVNKNTEIFKQLTGITEADLDGKDVRTTHYCIEALRHSINSFDRDRPIQSQPNSHPGGFRSIGGKQSWMA